MADPRALPNPLRSLAWAGLLAYAALSCTDTGTETDNPVIGFDASECKSDRSATALTLSGSARVAAAPAFGAGDEYTGLNCFAWEPRGADGLRVQVFNMIGGCHVVWERGPARWNGETLELTVRPDNCAVAGCGSCAYDLVFELDGVDRSAPLPLALYQDYCTGEREEPRARLTLPLDERPQGMLCRAGAWPFSRECGGAHGPICSDGEGGPNAGPCAEGLVRDQSSEPEVCLTPCTSDSDCPLEVESCQAGMCQLRETF